MVHPRLLVLSNNSFSKTDSNGRTLGSLLMGWPKDRLAQFCISTDGPDYEVCDNYYCVTDGDVLKSTFRLKPAKRRRLMNALVLNSNYVNGKKRYRKTALKMLLRNFVWNLGVWKGKQFNKWIDSFAPNIVLLQSGDSYFMHDLARKIARRSNAKLAVFNTEAAFLFHKDYFRSDASLLEKILFPLYKAVYNHRFRHFMNCCKIAVYGNGQLEKDYHSTLKNHCPSSVIYTASELDAIDKVFDTQNPRFSYLGNMGFNRPKALAIVGRVLQAISKDYYLDVYGDPQSESNEYLLRTSKGIRFHGKIDYKKVKEVIHNSDVIFHVEFDSNQYAEALKYGFSTKIADSIASKRLFVFFAPGYIAGSQYIKKTGAGVYCETEQQLSENIQRILSNENFRQNILNRSGEVAALNHDFTKNKAKMFATLASAD